VQGCLDSTDTECTLVLDIALELLCSVAEILLENIVLVSDFASEFVWFGVELWVRICRTP
jgi:hypothetical protein